MVSCQSQLTGSELRAQATKPLKRTHDARLDRDLSAIDQLVSRGEFQELAAAARALALRTHNLRIQLIHALEYVIADRPAPSARRAL